jgi:hypothetical protein
MQMSNSGVNNLGYQQNTTSAGEGQRYDQGQHQPSYAGEGGHNSHNFNQMPPSSSQAASQNRQEGNRPYSRGNPQNKISTNQMAKI